MYKIIVLGKLVYQNMLLGFTCPCVTVSMDSRRSGVNVCDFIEVKTSDDVIWMDLNTDRILLHRGRSRLHSSALLPCKLTPLRGHSAKINSTSQLDSSQNADSVTHKKAYADCSKTNKDLRDKTILQRSLHHHQYSLHISLTARMALDQNMLSRCRQGHARHVTARLTVFASREWLNTVHCVAQIQIKGSCSYALDVPAEL